jgi:predicted AAA+ superfamily ATPase
MRVASLRSGQLTNQSEMARDAGLKQPTVHRYLNLLETSYLLRRLSPYAVSRTKRVVKTPKLYMGDTGLAAFLAGILDVDSLRTSRLQGALLETAILCDLLAWKEAEVPSPEVMYWRTQSGDEVDFVVERGGKTVPIEVKSTAHPRLEDIKGLQAFLSEHPKTTPHGVLLYGGSRAERLADRVWAIPLSVALGLS